MKDLFYKRKSMNGDINFSSLVQVNPELLKVSFKFLQIFFLIYLPILIYVQDMFRCSTIGGFKIISRYSIVDEMKF